MTAPAGRTSRRGFLTGAAGLVGGGLLFGTGRDLLLSPAAAAAAQPSIKRRDEWGGDLAPKGPLPVERAGDVRFLLVHHTAGANGYAKGAVRATLRGIYDYHTGPKGWNDVAYNFFVDAFGGIWEGRKGSLEAPVRGDATGGSQGFALLCCFLGDHQVVPPTAAAQAAMADLLAWLAGTYGIDLGPRATATFVSRGSNRHPAGKQVTTSTIAAHRDMSNTTCPGDACYSLVKGQLSVTAAAKAGATAVAAPPTTASEPPTSTPTTGGRAPADPGSTTLPAASATDVGEDNPPPSGPPAAAPTEIAAPRTTTDRGVSTGRVLGIGGLGAAAAVAGSVVLRRRLHRADAESRWYSGELLNPPSDGAVPSAEAAARPASDEAPPSGEPALHPAPDEAAPSRTPRSRPEG